MAKPTTLTKERLKKILTAKLSLRDPQYELEKIGGLLAGDVISSTFKGKRDRERQAMIWDALEDELGADFANKVGMLLAYTPDEWNLDPVPVPRSRRQKVG